MSAREKSDLPEVAKKRANKAAPANSTILRHRSPRAPGQAEQLINPNVVAIDSLGHPLLLLA